MGDAEGSGAVDHARCDTTSGRFYDHPWDTYRWLRDHDPVHWDEANRLWVVSRHEDVTLVSTHPERYCNKFGVRPKAATPLSILTMDDPAHTQQRRLVNRGFTPRQVRRLAPHIEEISRQIIDEIQTRGEIEFVKDFAIHVPLIVIAELLGLDPSARDRLHRWSDDMMGGEGRTDPDDPALHHAGVAFGEYVAHVQPLIEERRTAPREDLISILTGAFDEGALDAGDSTALHHESMNDEELIMFLVALVVAGNETTRNAISGGLLAFSLFPEERDRLLARPELVDSAVEEIVRWVSPVLNFSRTVTEDHELHGRQLHEGDTVLMLYQSANRDERVFDEPDRFRIDRDPNPHVAFGIGPHYCLGANLAKLEIKTVFQELFARLPDIRVADGAHRARGDNALVLAIEELRAVFTPTATPA